MLSASTIWSSNIRSKPVLYPYQEILFAIFDYLPYNNSVTILVALLCF